jgi:outer membrane immunogenic protein
VEAAVRLGSIFVATALSLIATSGAMAADAIVQEPVPIAEAPVFTWTGGYVGIQGGYAWNEAEFDAVFGSGSRDFDGGLLGGFIGYNWQVGSFVFGVEGDINATWNDETFAFPGVEVEVGTDYLASIRGRVGYAWDRTLIFGTGGVAFTRASVDASAGGATFSEDQSYTGWTVGGGAEYAFTDNLIGRLEYRYYDFGKEDILGFSDVELNTHTVTAGFSYKF